MKTIAWDIWLYCNYDCKFCSTKTKNLPIKIYDIDDIFQAWKNIYNKYGKCKICITGGEPLLYPNINTIIEKLSIIHYVHITTNLSINVDLLSKINVNKNNIFFNITYHPYYSNIDDIINKLLQLRTYKYKFSICYMNDKFQLLEFLNYREILKEYGFDISLVSSIDLNNNYKIINNYIDNNSISLYNNKVGLNCKDVVCSAGIKYACVDNCGNAYSCSVMKVKLGNIFNNTFSFKEENIECNKECIVFENKY